MGAESTGRAVRTRPKAAARPADRGGVRRKTPDLEGATVAAIVAKVRRLPPHRLRPEVLLHAASRHPEPPCADAARLVASIGVQLARALSIVHQRGRVHGAIDAEHVLVDGRGRARLLAADPEHLPEGSSRAADLDRLARVLLSLLEARVLRLEGPLDRPRTIETSTRRDLWTVLAKATAPHGRGYAHAVELADDLQRLVDGQPVLAQRPEAFLAAARFVARHRRAVALLLIGAFAFTYARDAVSPRLARAYARGEHVSSLRARADAALRAGDGDGLRRCGVELVEHAPREARLLVELATALDAPGRPPAEALPEPTTPYEARLRARLERLRGDPEPALAAIERALALWPDDAELLAEHAWTLVEAGEYDAAYATLGRLDALGRADPTVLALAARCQLQLGRLGEAAGSIGRLPPGGDEADLLAAELARRIGPWDRAEALSAALVARLPEDPRAWAQRLAVAPEEAPARLAGLAGADPAMRGPRALDLLRALVRLRDWEQAAPLAQALAETRADGFLWWTSVLHWDGRAAARDEALAAWRAVHPTDPRPELLAARWAAQAEDGDAALDAGLAGGTLGAGRRRQIAAWFARDGRASAWEEALRPTRFEESGIAWFEPAAFWPDLALHDPAGVLARLAPLARTAPAREVVLRARLLRDRGDVPGALELVAARLQAGLLRGRDADLLATERRRLQDAAEGDPPPTPVDGPLNVCTAVLLAPRVRTTGRFEDDAPGELIGGTTPRHDDPVWSIEGPLAGGPALQVDVDLGWSFPIGRLAIGAATPDALGRPRAWSGTVEVLASEDGMQWTSWPAFEPDVPDPLVVQRTLGPGARGRWLRVRLLPADPAARYTFSGIEVFAR